MTAGLLKRVGLIVLAIAFLGGGLPHGAIFTAASASAGAVIPHTHALHMVHGGSHTRTGNMPDTRATDCQHNTDCVSCVAIDLPTGHRLAAALTWRLITFKPGTPPLSGLKPAPELFPPIRQS
jgi:hypothetical protein